MKRFIYILAAIVFLLPSCDKNNNDRIPLVAVDLYLNINNPEFINLNNPGGWLYYVGGSRGLIIYKSTANEFKVYDRHCTFNPENSCALVTVEVNNITLKDDCCGSQFLLTDGSVTTGPAAVSLKQYRTSFDGSLLHIYN